MSGPELDPELSSLVPEPDPGGRTRPPPKARVPWLGRRMGRSNSAPLSDPLHIAAKPCSSNGMNCIATTTDPVSLADTDAAVVADKTEPSAEDKGRSSNRAAFRERDSTAECRNGLLLSPLIPKHGGKPTPMSRILLQQQQHEQPHQHRSAAGRSRRRPVRTASLATTPTAQRCSLATPPQISNSLRVCHPLQLDYNAVPLIDSPITPPGSPTPESMRAASYRVFPARRLTAGRTALTRHTSLLQHRRPPRRHPGHESPPPEFDSNARNPTITITMNEDDNNNDDDDGGGHSDDFSNDDDEDFVENHHKQDGIFNYGANHTQMQFIGDNTSLFGMNKDEVIDIEPSKSGTSTTNYLKDQLVAFFQPSDNKLAMKLFGNRNALLKEKMRQKATGNWVIHPCSDFRFYWDLFMLILLIANLIILPVAISFFNDDLSLRWIIFNSVSDTVFILDLIINFRTGIIADNFADEIILEPREIARRYFKSWFFLDLISSVPLDYIILLFGPAVNVTQLMHAGRALRMFRLVKLLSLLRLLRLSRLVRYISQWEEFINVAGKFMRIGNLVCLMLLLGHWNACLLWLVAFLQDFPPDSWASTNELQFLSIAGMFMRIFNLICLMLLIGHWNGCLQFLVPMLQDFPSNSWVSINELQHAHWLDQYTWALFKALSHMLCIGYGRYPPQSTTDVWLTMVSMLTGATCYALFVGHATTLIQSFDTSKRLYREKFKQVEEYMSYRKLPRNLRQKINNYYEHRYQGKMFDEDRILGELNDCLREDIVNYNCRALVASVPFFAHADPTFVSEIVTKLQYEVYLPGEYVIREGTVGLKMYYIQEGIVDIVTKDGEVATSLSDGSYFGEICLLTNAKRVASVRAETYCNLFSLSVEHFNAVLEHYPVVRRTMESVAAERLNKIGKNPDLVSSRGDMKDDISAVQKFIEETTPLVTSESDSSVDRHSGHSEYSHRRTPTDVLLKAKQVLRKCRSEGDFSKTKRTKESTV